MVKDCIKCGKPTISPASVCLRCGAPKPQEPLKTWMSLPVAELERKLRAAILEAEEDASAASAEDVQYTIGYRHGLKTAYRLLTGERFKK